MRKFFKSNSEASKALLTTKEICSEKDDIPFKKNKKTKSLSPSSFLLNSFNNDELPKTIVDCINPSLNYLSGVSKYYKDHIESIEIILKKEKQKSIRKTKSFQLLVNFGLFEKKTGSVDLIEQEQDKVREYIVIKFKNPTELNKTEFFNITFDIKMAHKGKIGQDYKIIIEDHEQISHLDFTEINTEGFITVSGESLINIANNNLLLNTIGL